VKQLLVRNELEWSTTWIKDESATFCTREVLLTTDLLRNIIQYVNKTMVSEGSKKSKPGPALELERDCARSEYVGIQQHVAALTGFRRHSHRM
jgi:hypothetical protein